MHVTLVTSASSLYILLVKIKAVDFLVAKIFRNSKFHKLACELTFN